MEYILAISYNRWAMEAVTIREAAHYQGNMRNTIIMIFKVVTRFTAPNMAPSMYNLPPATLRELPASPA